MIYCLNCGKGIPDESNFCTFCGTAIPHMDPQKPDASTLPPAYRQETAIKPSPTAPHGVKNEFYKNAGFWGAVITLVGFFLPWTSTGFASLSLLDTMRLITQVGDQYTLFWLLLLFPVCGLLLIVNSFTNKISSGLVGFCKVIPFILFLVLCIISFAFREYAIIPTGSYDLKSAFDIIGIGMWAIVMGSLLMLFYKTSK